MLQKNNQDANRRLIGALCLASALFLPPSSAQSPITNWGDGADSDPRFSIGLDPQGKIVNAGAVLKRVLDPATAKSVEPQLAARAYNNLGWIYRSTDCKKALSYLDKAIELDPNYTRAYYNRVLTYTDMQNWPAVITACDKVMQLDPKCDVIYFHRAQAYGGLKQWQKVVDDCNTAIKRKPDFAMAYTYRGFAYEKLGKNDLAKTDKEKGYLTGRAEQ